MSTGVTYPRGFVAAGIAAGLKPSGAPDLALLVGAVGTTAAGLFTTNAAVAAPVVLSRKHLAAGGGRGVLVNSGQANAATGTQGDDDAFAAVAAAAQALDVEVSELSRLFHRCDRRAGAHGRTARRAAATRHRLGVRGRRGVRAGDHDDRHGAEGSDRGGR